MKVALVMSCHFTKTRTHNCTAHSRVTFHLFFCGWHYIDGICDKKLNRFVVLRLTGLYLYWSHILLAAGSAIDVATGEHHYSLVSLRSCYPGNLLVFLLLNCWDSSRKSKRCWITIFVIVQNWNPTPNLLYYLLKPSSLIDSKSLYLDLFPLEVLVPLNKQVR